MRGGYEKWRTEDTKVKVECQARTLHNQRLTCMSPILVVRLKPSQAAAAPAGFEAAGGLAAAESTSADPATTLRIRSTMLNVVMCCSRVSLTDLDLDYR